MTSLKKVRGLYGSACNMCAKRKQRCGGEPGSVCPPCQYSGRDTICNWDSYFTRRNRGVTEPPKRIEAIHKLLIEYHEYSYKLEALLEKYGQTSSKDFRLERPKDPDGLLGLSITLADLHLDKKEDVTMQDYDLPSPTNFLLWHDVSSSTLVEAHYGISSPFRFRSDPLPLPSRFPAIAEDPELTYVLMVGPVTDTNYNPHFNWSRYLPSAVALDRGSHDNALNDLFRYCTSFCLRLIPDLFLKDMCRVLSVPRSQEPKTAHYSPMLHNSIVALALAFSDDPRFRDLKARQYFIDAAKSYMEAECQKPTLAVVQALSFLGTFYGSQGDQGLGFMYFGLSARMAQVLGLDVDCSDYVERKLMDPFDVIDRNWTAWSIFTSDVCWSLYVGREFATTVPDDDFPLPYIDTALDDMPVVYGNLAPQPNYTTKTFHANAELFVLGRDILEVNNMLSKTKARPIEVFDRVDYVNTKLNEWCASLPPDLHLTTKNRSMATPHKLLLHLSYWWLFVLLHRPLFHYRTSMKAGRQIDHIKLCKRAADGIMENLKSWQDLYGLRFCPITLIQIAFSAGTVYLLLAVQACSGTHVAKKQLGNAIHQQKLVTEYLLEIGKSWPGANKIVEILKDLMQKKLTPLLEKIPVRNNDNQVITEEDEYPTPVPHSPSHDRGRGQPGQTSPSKNKREKSLRGGRGSQPIPIHPQQPPFSHTSSTMPLTTASPPKSVTIPHPISTTSHHQSHSNVSGFVIGSPRTPDAKTLSTSSSLKVATTIRASTSHDHSTFQPVYPPSGNPPQSLPFFSLTESMEDYAGQSDFHGSQIQPSSYPNTGFLGMPQGQTLPHAPFWNHISMEEQNVSLLASLDEFINNPSSFIPPTTDGPTDYLNFNEMDTDVSMAEHDDWCQSIFEISSSSVSR